jgi:hypothetical protein
VIDTNGSKTAAQSQRVRDHVRKMLSKLAQLQQQKRIEEQTELTRKRIEVDAEEDGS